MARSVACLMKLVLYVRSQVVRTITAADGGRQRTTALLAAAEARNLGAVTAVIKAFLAIVDGSISNSGSGGGDDEVCREVPNFLCCLRVMKYLRLFVSEGGKRLSAG